MHWSFALLIAYVGYDGFREAGLGGALWSIAFMLTCFTCIVLHELGHSFTAMRFGISIRRILVMPIGGMAEFDSIPRLPRQELLITVAGPAVNFTIAALLWTLSSELAPAASSTPASLREFGWLLMWTNVWFGCFNLTPAFPMDGGRIVRALLAYRLPYVRATFWAATIGKVVAVIGIGIGAYFQLWLLVALFIFILSVGEIEYRSVRVQERHAAEWAAIADRFNRVGRGELPPEPPLLGPN